MIGIFDDGDDGRLIQGGFTSYDSAQWYAEQLQEEEPDQPVRIELQCSRHSNYPDGDCEVCDASSASPAAV